MTKDERYRNDSTNKPTLNGYKELTPSTTLALKTMLRADLLKLIEFYSGSQEVDPRDVIKICEEYFQYLQSHLAVEAVSNISYDDVGAAELRFDDVEAAELLLDELVEGE